MDGPLFLSLPALAMPSVWLDFLHPTLVPGFVPKWKDKSTSHVMQHYKMRERDACARLKRKEYCRDVRTKNIPVVLIMAGKK